jgi:Phosphotransferase enzyme family
MDDAVSHEALTRASAARSLAVACGQSGLDPHQAKLLRLGENAIYALPSEGVVVRVARSDTADIKEKVAKELAVSEWLTSHGFPAVRSRGDIPQPVRADGRMITFWEYVPPSSAAPDLSDLARLLRAFHALPDPHFDVALLNPFPVMRRRLASADGIDQGDIEFLTAACDHIEPSFRALVTGSQRGLIHGDAHQGNLLVSDGQVLLIDYEAVAVGPRAWDLIPAATAVDRFGLPRAQYAAFCRAYGHDVTDWEGYETLRSVRELGMTTWLMQNAQSGPPAAEFNLRMQSLREEDRERRWHAL